MPIEMIRVCLGMWFILTAARASGGNPTPPGEKQGFAVRGTLPWRRFLAEARATSAGL
jgi:hypothetical protein